jgi:hypothetical protein
VAQAQPGRVAQLTGAGVDLQARLEMPRPPGPEQLRSFYFREIEDLFGGLVKAGEQGFYIGRLPLLTFGPAVEVPGGWEWPIADGLLARPRAADKGRLRITSEGGAVTVAVAGFRPWLPSDVYALTQRPFHRAVTWLTLRRLRRALGD